MKILLIGLHWTIEKLAQRGEISKIQGLTYVVRMGFEDHNIFSLNENREGYLTLEQGTKAIALNLENRKGGRVLNFLPIPKH